MTVLQAYGGAAHATFYLVVQRYASAPSKPLQGTCARRAQAAPLRTASQLRHRETQQPLGARGPISHAQMEEKKEQFINEHPERIPSIYERGNAGAAHLVLLRKRTVHVRVDGNEINWPTRARFHFCVPCEPLQNRREHLAWGAPAASRSAQPK